MSERRGFRPDIEGLRGVAILLVVLFHAGVRAFAGGFVGVDVFLVLSGYFITGLLVRELDETGSIDVQRFWSRRAVRLLPPLLIVFAATLAAVMLIYAPIDRAPIAATARSVALYSGNIEFARTSTDYFRAADNPLLHTWSLAVEEQFYLVWPLLFIAVALIGARIASRSGTSSDTGSQKRRLLIGIVLAGALSFALSIWLTRVSQPWAFFGMPTRIWEFALGGALTLVAIDSADANGVAATLLQWIGIVAIAIGVATYDRATPYPGVAAVLPACGAVALIVGGARAPSSFISRVLAAPWLRWLGALSYAWYLWHWPLVGLGAVLDWNIGVGGRLAWSACALLLAWLTRRFVEQPAREGRLVSVPDRSVAPAALLVSLVAAIGAHVALVSSVRAASAAPQQAFAAARLDRMQHDCWATTVEDWRGPCEFGDRRSSTTLVLIGDSHAEHWLGALDRAGKENGWRIVALVKGGCPVAEMPSLADGRAGRYWRECVRFHEWRIRKAIAMRPAAVILSSWDHYTAGPEPEDWQVTRALWLAGLSRTYKRLADARIHTLVLRGTPKTGFDVPACLSRRAARLMRAPKCEYRRDAALHAAAIEAQNSAAAGLPIAMIDMNDQICNTATCGVWRNGAIVFTDDNHLTASFSRSVAPVLAERIQTALH